MVQVEGKNVGALQVFQASADGLLTKVLFLHLAICIGLAAYNGSWGPALLIGVPAAAVPYLLMRMEPGGLVSRLAVAAAFMIDSALLIHQAQGMLEAHFGIFVLLAFLVLYCDIAPVILAAAVIAVHHVVFAILQARGFGVFIFPQAGTVGLVTLHAVYVVIESVVLCFVTTRLRNMVLDAALVSQFASEAGQGRINYRFAPEKVRSSAVVAAVAQMQERLRESLTVVRESAERLADYAKRLNSSASGIATSSADQSDSTANMAAAVEEMATSIATITAEATDARQYSQASRDAARDGNTVVKDAVAEISGIAGVIAEASGSVEALGEKSERAAQIVNIIQEIADQTNLLALNAAIEAARAGETGRGFAVVADEVRKLAERTTKATNEINQMMAEMRSSKDMVLVSINEAVSKVESGVGHANQAGGRMDEITAQAERVGGVIESISGSLTEQSTVTEQIARHVEQIAQRADAASSATRDIAQEARSVEEVASRLRNTMAQFTL